MASENLRQFSQAAFTSGGTIEETARLKTLGGSLGMSAGDMAQMARGFAQAVGTDPLAGGVAAQHGVYDYDPRGVYGNTDKAGELTKAIQIIMNDKSDSDAIRLARLWNIEGALALRNLSEGTRGMLAIDAKISAQVNDKQSQRQAQEFYTNLQRAGDGLENLLAAGIEPLIPILTEFIGLFATIVQGLSGALKWVNQYTTWGMMAKGLDAAHSPTRALDANTHATIQNTAVIMGHTRAIYGGGSRAQKIIPTGWGGYPLQKGLQDGSLRMGATTP
jgi:hypothetical protein